MFTLRTIHSPFFLSAFSTPSTLLFITAGKRAHANIVIRHGVCIVLA
jgi:hypothetical protein